MKIDIQKPFCPYGSCHFHDNYIILFCYFLAATMVEAGRDKKNPDEFAVALDETLGDFAFPDEFVFDVWGAIGDAKQGRLEWELCSLSVPIWKYKIIFKYIQQNFNKFIDTNPGGI